jgi:hypothetical protein
VTVHHHKQLASIRLRPPRGAAGPTGPRRNRASRVPHRRRGGAARRPARPRPPRRAPAPGRPPHRRRDTRHFPWPAGFYRAARHDSRDSTLTARLGRTLCRSACRLTAQGPGQAEARAWARVIAGGLHPSRPGRRRDRGAGPRRGLAVGARPRGRGGAAAARARPLAGAARAVEALGGAWGRLVGRPSNWRNGGGAGAELGEMCRGL